MRDALVGKLSDEMGGWRVRATAVVTMIKLERDGEKFTIGQEKWGD